MCLAVPGRIVDVAGDGTAVVDRAGTRSTVSLLASVVDVAVGDWVLVHSGFVLDRLPANDVSAFGDLAATAEPATNPDPRRTENPR